jgi:hypothetical protein
MLSTKLVQLIEKSSEIITSGLLLEIRQDPQMSTLAGRSDAELRAWSQDILKNVGYLLAASKGEELARRFQILGRLRFEQNIPLHEAVLRCQVLKNKILRFVRDQAFAMTPMELYAEEELDRRIGWLFDAMVYHIVRGYESAERVASQLAS